MAFKSRSFLLSEFDELQEKKGRGNVKGGR
jgi:hypothetical protein